MKKIRAILSIVVALSGGVSASATTLRVFAAASLAESFQEIGKRFEAKHTGFTVEYNFAGSQVLRTQIEQGAPADVFASADQVQMKPLVQSRQCGTAVVFAHNSLVVVTPAARAKVRRLVDLLRPGIRLVLASENVPAGRYAGQTLRNLDAAPGFGPGFEVRVLKNVVSRETNVRSVLSKVILGEADAGIVYVTDAATAKGRVNLLSIPSKLNATASYAIAVVTDSRQKAMAEEFVRLALSPEGQRILARHGFKPGHG